MESRVNVAVSEEMYKLRELQRTLNRFLWSTELAYGIVAAQLEGIGVPSELTSDMFKHIRSQAWYPNNQGKLKYAQEAGQFLADVNSNMVHVFRATVIYMSSALEAYLDERVTPVLANQQLRAANAKGNWGPFMEKLAALQTVGDGPAIEHKCLANADIARLIRNCLVHPPFKVPQTRGDDSWQALYRRFEASLKAFNAKSDAGGTETSPSDMFESWVGLALQQAKAARRKGNTVPVELFYTLYSLTSFDTLAFQIEERLLPAGCTGKFVVSRKKSGVRRLDLIKPTCKD